MKQITDITEIEKLLATLPPLMAEKGCVNPSAEYHIAAESENNIWLRSASDMGAPIGEYGYSVFRGEFAKCLIEAKAHIIALPNPEDATLRRHMGRVAKVIDQGRDDGIPVEYVDPLTVVVDAMSENLLTKG